MEENTIYPVIKGYFESNPKCLIVVLIPRYFAIYKLLRNKYYSTKTHFTAEAISNILRTGGYSRVAHKALYILFGRRVLVATETSIDNDFRKEAFGRRAGCWASVPPKTVLKSNLKANVICAENNHEARKVQSFLSRITKKDGSTDLALAQKLHLATKKERYDIIELEKKVAMCLNILRK